ncbi:uncharacterized protein LOC123448147 [Hordeum vulgare subsp. vulgare]|uniref:uncharacterized protein LOC123448147 n=1 Tax=Hordeum vulgare subsp. vulgare TaxID=112509 RepID=UPI001D1A552A|nr:uncharacterized protein LOC123448147 [Hordeum vulgare subsp. vulgare]
MKCGFDMWRYGTLQFYDIAFFRNLNIISNICVSYVGKQGCSLLQEQVKNWQAISTIYSKDHATGAGAKTGAECAQPQSSSVAQVGDDDAETPEPPKKRARAADAILSMVGELRCTFDEALKTTDAQKVTPPSEILAALKEIPGLEGDDLLRAYGKLTANERTFESLMALPRDLRKPWLLTLPR